MRLHFNLLLSINLTGNIIEYKYNEDKIKVVDCMKPTVLQAIAKIYNWFFSNTF